MPSPSVAEDTTLVYETLPQFVQDLDADNGWPFLLWLNGAGELLQSVDTLARDDDEGNPGWSIVLDVTRCPTAMLPWLAQFVGVRFNPAQLTDAQQRAAITAMPCFARGTVATITAAALAQLGAGTITIIERTPDPYSLTIEAAASDLTGGTWGELVNSYATWAAVEVAYATWAAIALQTAAFEAAVLATIPAGLVVTFVFE